MDFDSQRNSPNIGFGTPHDDYGWLCPVQPETKMDFLALDGLFDMDIVPWQSQNNPIMFSEFPDLEDFSCDFARLEYDLPSMYEDIVIDKKPLNSVPPPKAPHCYSIQTGLAEASVMKYGTGFVNCAKKEEETEGNNIGRKKRSAVLEFDEIKKHFDVPITKAAKRMNVGLTLLKRRCRELNILRWPHRKIKSLKTLINNVKELGLTNEVAMLEQHKMLVEQVPDIELSEQTKKLRQACFKANYKKRRSLAYHA